VPEPETAEDALRDLIDGERSSALLAAVKDLPPGYRDAVVLCDLEERSYEEAAKVMDCPVGTVRSRLHRARALLTAKLRWMRTAGEGQGVRGR
jgi:RNA polymerase sigma-70 factor (ECF subfamily)